MLGHLNAQSQLRLRDRTVAHVVVYDVLVVGQQQRIGVFHLHPVSHAAQRRDADAEPDAPAQRHGPGAMSRTLKELWLVFASAVFE